MPLISSVMLAVISTLAFAPPDNPGPTQVRAAVERSLPFLLAGGEAWREGSAGGGQNGRICVTCHQIPFTIWSHTEADARGIAFDQKRVADLTEWTLDWCFTQKHPKTQSKTGGFLATMQQLIMGRDPAPPGAKNLETYTLFGKVIPSMQKPEGWWKEGNQIKGAGTPREADEVDTMWVVLGLNSLEKIPALPKETIEASAKSRALAMAWLKGGKPGTRTDWFALRLMLEREFGDAKQVPQWLTQILDRQNPDGGWPMIKGEPSHVLVTGQCLYVLSLAGKTADDPAVRKAWKYLLDTQQKNGSWRAPSRNDPFKTNIVTIHWATGWATIGLLRTLPAKAD